MINELPTLDMPQWLKKIDENPEKAKKEPFPLIDILTDSLYYPASGFDGVPVKYLAGNIYSFIYVDYNIEEKKCRDMIYDKETGFKGYEVIFERNVSKEEITPLGWQPSILPKESDFEGIRYIRKEERWSYERENPYAIWFVLKRTDDYDDNHGPLLFSLFILKSDGVPAYEALYVRNKLIPKVLCIHQPGHTFGGNWTNFYDENSIFKRVVKSNTAGMPEYLFSEYRGPCWEEYEEVPLFEFGIPGYYNGAVYKLKSLT